MNGILLCGCKTMKKIKELFIPKELAILAKEFGFDDPVIGFFDIETDELYPSIQEVNTLIEVFRDSKETYKNYCLDDSVFIDYNGYISFAHEYPAITYDQITKWFRDKYNLNLCISYKPNIKKWDYIVYDLSLNGKQYVKFYSKYYKENPNREFDSYYDALNKAIKETFELI